MLISSILLAVNASFYERVARLTKSVFPLVNLLSFFASAMVKSTFGSSSSSQEAAFLIVSRPLLEYGLLLLHDLDLTA